MIVFTTTTEAERELVQRVLAAAEWKVGHPIPHRFAAIRGQSLETLAEMVDVGTMTHATAAEVLGCSTRTVRRRVADGTLEQRGRRVTVRSVLTAGGAR